MRITTGTCGTHRRSEVFPRFPALGSREQRQRDLAPFGAWALSPGEEKVLKTTASELA